MARIRSIKPSFFTSLTICKLALDTRLTFAGLWTHCDDEGRCVYEPRLIKAALWPLDDSVTPHRVAEMIEELELNNLVQTYEVNGIEYLQVVGFKEHQHINRPAPSKYPTPPVGLTEPSVSLHGTLPSGREGKGKEGKGKEQGEGSARAQVREALPESSRSAFDAILRASRNAEGVVAVVASLHAPISGGHPAYPWEVIGAALVDYAGKSPSEFSAKLLRAICADFAERPAGPATEHDRERARRDAIEAARRFQQRGEPAEVA